VQLHLTNDTQRTQQDEFWNEDAHDEDSQPKMKLSKLLFDKLKGKERTSEQIEYWLFKGGSTLSKEELILKENVIWIKEPNLTQALSEIEKEYVPIKEVEEMIKEINELFRNRSQKEPYTHDKVKQIIQSKINKLVEKEKCNCSCHYSNAKHSDGNGGIKDCDCKGTGKKE